ncbi:MAG: hypothetical protein AAFV46_07210, partial [Cyanobacteria bacterium J06635_11]
MTTLLSVQLRLAQQVRPLSTPEPSVVPPSIIPVSTALKPAKSDTSTSLKAATRATHHQVRRQLDAIAQDLLFPTDTRSSLPLGYKRGRSKRLKP